MIEHRIDLYSIFSLSIKELNRRVQKGYDVKIINNTNPNFPLVRQISGILIISDIEEDKDFLEVSKSEFYKGKLTNPLKIGLIKKSDLKELFL